MGVSFNTIVRDRAWQKMRELDAKNNGDKLATMRDFIKWARKGTGERTTAINYGEYIEVGVSKKVSKYGVSGNGYCRVYFYANGDVMEIKYIV